MLTILVGLQMQVDMYQYSTLDDRSSWAQGLVCCDVKLNPTLCATGQQCCQQGNMPLRKRQQGKPLSEPYAVQDWVIHTRLVTPQRCVVDHDSGCGSIIHKSADLSQSGDGNPKDTAKLILIASSESTSGAWWWRVLASQFV